jgi:uncharacterized damage-inducible protein DinB
VSISDPTADVLELLKRERAGLLTSVGQVPEPLRGQRPSSEQWSVAEILEHLVKVERSIARALEALVAARAALVAAFLAAEPAALDGVTQRHPAIGLLTLRGWVLFVGHHEARHAAQVAEVAEALR